MASACPAKLPQCFNNEKDTMPSIEDDRNTQTTTPAGSNNANANAQQQQRPSSAVENLLKGAKRPNPPRGVKYSVGFEGWLKKKGDHGIPHLKTWNYRYFVLYEDADELRYYGNMVRSCFGPVPLEEHGSIPLEHIQQIVPTDAEKWKGCRFDIQTSCDKSHYPLETSEPGTTSKRIYSLLAPSSTERDLWVRTLRAATRNRETNPES